MENIWGGYYPAGKSFQLQDLSRILNTQGYRLSEETIRKRLKKAVDAGELIKEGRNRYCVPCKGMGQYAPSYSDYADKIAEVIQKQYPNLDFSVFELVQLNEFVNHQIAHDIVFISVEPDTADFVFDTLKLVFPGKVLIQPTPDLFHQYWTENMIVITRLISQRPVFKTARWHVRLETMLVDLFSDPLLKSSVSESEYPTILENTFRRYVLDENSLFRYAKRRNAAGKIRKMIKEKTDIVLRTEE